MESLNIKKHWNKFNNESLAVHCESEDLAKEFLKYCQDKGMRWHGGGVLLDTQWEEHKEKTCYWGNRNYISYSSIDYCQELNTKVVGFEGFNQDKYKSKIPTITTKEIFDAI